MDTNYILQEQDRQKLDGIVKKMIDNGESDSDIKTVVSDFKKIYGKKPSTAQKALSVSASLLGPFGGLATKTGRAQLAEGARLVGGSTLTSMAKPLVSFTSGVSGLLGAEEPNKAVNFPIIGPVSPYASPKDAGTTALARKLGANVSPEQVLEAKRTQPERTLGQLGTAATSYLEAGVPGLSAVAKKPITLLAEKLYQSALKPSTKLAPEAVKDIVQTGLKENVWLTQGGVERAAAKIDDLEKALGAAIEEGKAAGAKIELKGLKDFVDPIRKWYDTVDVAGSKSAKEYIDKTIKDLSRKYGKSIPIEEAQKLKVNTTRMLRNAYGELSNVQKETQKQITRFLKEGIVEKAPAVGTINNRLKSLYRLDEALGKASNRVGNLNLLGLGSKVLAGAGATIGGTKGALLGLLGGIATKPALKSGAAIGLQNLANGVGQAANAVRIPTTMLLNQLLGKERK